MIAGSAPPPCGPLPDARQRRWHELECYAFVHLCVNTFTGQEWGYGSEPPSLFNPAALDCRQWARVCQAAGMKGIILTAKHHGGFCLWPSRYTAYSVKNSPWQDGKGDVMRGLAEACAEYGLKLGVYLSPWDRNHGGYGRPEYVRYFRSQLRELLTAYGPVFELWLDGANGGDGFYGGANEMRRIDRAVYYDWDNTINLVRELQPETIIWNEAGPDIRWCGNEAGSVGETNWNLLDSGEFTPGEADPAVLRSGRENGNHWTPAEVNTSIRPGWFYHEAEDNQVKSVSSLLDIYYASVGRGSTLLLNFPVDKRGLIHECDAQRSQEFAAALKGAFAVNLAEESRVSASSTRASSSAAFAAGNVLNRAADSYWAADENGKEAALTFEFASARSFNCVLLQEYTPLGQRVKAFTLEARLQGAWKTLACGTTIGYKRILRFPEAAATHLRLAITCAKAPPVLSAVGIYHVSPAPADPDAP